MERWKEGSHGFVENTHADESRCHEIALERNLQTEPAAGQLGALLSSLEIRTTDGGGLQIDAPPAAAEALIWLFRDLAEALERSRSEVGSG